jgi:fatty-acyl-CoA synthase
MGAAVSERERRELTESHWPAVGEGPLRRLTMQGVIAAATARCPDRIALIDGVSDGDQRRRWTYRELKCRGEQMAAALLERFEPGDHVALWAPNSLEWVLFQIGAGLAGLVLVTVNPAYRGAELDHVLRQSRARGLYFQPTYRGRNLEEIAEETAASIPAVTVLGRLDDLVARADQLAPGCALPDVAVDDIAQIQYTSGTTGAPKGAMLAHGSISASYYQTLRRAGFDEDTPPTWVASMPLFHIGGAGGATIGTMTLAGTHVVLPGFDVELICRLIEAERGSVTLAVPTMLVSVLEHPALDNYDLSSLRTILTGAAPVPAELVVRVRDRLRANVVICFGQTEFSGNVSTTGIDDSPQDIASTVGVPLDHAEVKITDPVSGAIVPIGMPGEICARGHHVMAGYHRAPAETAAAIDHDGWLHFGDIGTMDDRGYLQIIGRVKDMVIRGGENIYPREVEDVLVTHPLVGDVAVVGAADPTWGEEVAAVVRVAPGVSAEPDPAELFAFCRERLAGYKCPRLWFYITEFPQTPSGKIQKHRLVSMIAQGELSPAGAFSRKVGEAPPDGAVAQT